MMCVLQTAFSLLLMLLAPMVVVPFGHDGHQIVASIAESRISKHTALVVKDVLDGETMEDVANWADDITKEKDWTASLHFINVEQEPCDNSSACTIEYKRDCTNNICVAGAIVNYTVIEQQLSPRHLNSSAANQALKFVIHFVGDIHQPLHVARDSDRGGVITDVHFYVPGQGSDWNLHNVWDFGMIVRSINETYDGQQELFTADILSKLSSEWESDINDWLLCNRSTNANINQNDKAFLRDTAEIRLCVLQWGQESLNDATSIAYLNELGVEIQEGDYISDEYYESRLGEVQRRLAMAGVRLAALLDRLFADTVKDSS